MENSNSKDNVRVVLRVRPLNNEELSGWIKKWVAVSSNRSISIDSKPDPKVFVYDHIVDENESQESVFENVAKPIVDYWLEGYNGTIFAYGQTGSGKTYTIQGPNVEDIESGNEFEESVGIMPRAFAYIFSRIREKEENDDWEFLVKWSYFEIYNEHIMDLLDPDRANLLIREDIKKGVYVEGLTEEITTSSSDLEELMKRGLSNRHVGATSMNERSSRSHSVLTTTIESKNQKDGLWNIRVSRFHIIDLAGSERSKSANTAGERLKEAGMINKSLSILGNVINSLVEVSEGRVRHIHYRDSKLTFLLRDSLGGNSKTLIIANISPNSNSFGETLSTMKFAQRAKLIKNKAIINEDSAGTVAILKEEIKRLKHLLAKQQKNEPDGSIHQLFSNTLEKLNILDEKINDPESPLKEINMVTKKRIIELEKLLQQNLDYNSQTQEYYDKDVEERDQIIKKLQIAVEAFEKQRTRDKMIIKFRDSTIQRFSNLSDKLDSEKSKIELQNKNTEIELLNQQIELNPQAAKLFAENMTLKKENEEMKKFVDKTKDSMYAQYRSCIEFNASLNKYIKSYIEKEEMNRDEIIRTQVDIERAELKAQHEEELSRLEEIIYQSNANNERLVKEINDIDQERLEGLETILRLKNEVESIKQSSAEEIELSQKRFAESLDQVKAEVKEGKDNEIQEFKIKLIESEKKVEEIIKEIHKLTEQKANSESWISEMKMSLEILQKEKMEILLQTENLKSEIESKDNLISELKEIEKFKIALEGETANLKTENKKLEKNLSKSNDLYNSTNESLLLLKDKYSQLEEEHDTSIKEYDYKFVKLQEELNSILEKQTEAENKLKSRDEAEEYLKLELVRQSSKTEDIIHNFEHENEQLKNKWQELVQKLEIESNKNNELELRLSIIEKDKEELQIEYETKTQLMTVTNQEQLEKYQNLINENNRFEEDKSQYLEKINELEQRIENLTAMEVSKMKLIKNFEKENSGIKEQLKKKEEELEALKQLKTTNEKSLSKTSNELKECQEFIDQLKDEKQQLHDENEGLRLNLINLEEKLTEIEMEKQFYEDHHRESKENMHKHHEDSSSVGSLEEKDDNAPPRTTISPEEAKKLLYWIKRREKEYKQRENNYKEQIEDLQLQLDKLQTLSNFEGHTNPGQKIKHILKIKEENNLLKKEIWKLFSENRKLKEQKDDENTKGKDVDFYESKAKKYKAELEKKRRELKETYNKANKMWDYILSRPLLPESISKVENDMYKMKQAIEAIAYMSRSIQKRDKEMTEVQREKNELQYTLEAIKRERDYLKKNIEVMAKNELEKKRKA